MNRIVERFLRLKKEGKKGFIVYIGAGDPNLGATRQLALAFDKAGVDGLLVLDLPPEESDNYEQLLRDAGLCNIYLVAPTTPDARIELIVKRATGFIYYISREGVTGMQEKVAANLADRIAKIRQHTG